VGTLWFKVEPCKPAVPIEANHTYLVGFAAAFSDGLTASASASVVAGAGEGGCVQPTRAMPPTPPPLLGGRQDYIEHPYIHDSGGEAATTHNNRDRGDPTNTPPFTHSTRP